MGTPSSSKARSVLHRGRPALLGAAASLLLLVGCAQATPGTAPTTEPEPLHLVVIGDSIPFNSAEDCPNCTGFVDRYAKALGTATTRPVTTDNLSEHTGLTLPGLLTELPQFADALTSADAVIVGIAHNSSAFNQDSICGATYDDTTYVMSDWSKIDTACARTSAEKYRSSYDRLYQQVADWRAGKPTILLTINRYNDWIGWKEAKLTRDQQRRTTVVFDAWNAMIAKSAAAHGFTTADIYHAFSGPDGTEPAGDLLAGDYTHPSDKGNAVIAEVLTRIGFRPLV